MIMVVIAAMFHLYMFIQARQFSIRRDFRELAWKECKRSRAFPKSCLLLPVVDLPTSRAQEFCWGKEKDVA